MAGYQRSWSPVAGVRSRGLDTVDIPAMAVAPLFTLEPLTFPTTEPPKIITPPGQGGDVVLKVGFPGLNPKLPLRLEKGHAFLRVEDIGLNIV